MEMPTARKSLSVWVFLISGGLLGFLVWLALFFPFMKVWSPEKESKIKSDLPFVRV